MADIKAIAEELVNLTVKEVNELAQVLKDEYGIVQPPLRKRRHRSMLFSLRLALPSFRL